MIGYYSLSAGSLDANVLPEAFRRRLPKVSRPRGPAGAARRCRIPQGMGLGSILLADALQRIAQASQVMAVYAVVVDALNDQAAEFYRQFGFIPMPSQPLKLFAYGIRCLTRRLTDFIGCIADKLWCFISLSCPAGINKCAGSMTILDLRSLACWHAKPDFLAINYDITMFTQLPQRAVHHFVRQTELRRPAFTRLVQQDRTVVALSLDVMQDSIGCAFSG